MPSNPTSPRQYRAFISYSHSADGRLGPALQNGLQQFGKPWYRRRALRIFRDQTGLAVTPDLWGSIERALANSDYLILLASPPAAASKWVQQEVEWWLCHRSPDRLLIVLTEGDLAWNAAASDFDWATTTSLPRQLERVFASEPLHVDLRWAENETDLSLRRPQFADAVARLAATLHGKSLDDLIGEDVRQHTATLRLIRAGVGVLVLLTVLAVFTAVIALRARRTAEGLVRGQAASAAATEGANSSRALAQTALGQLASPELAILLAAEAVRIHPTDEAVSALRQTLAAPIAPTRSFQGTNSPLNIIAYRPDGRQLLLWNEHRVQLLEPASGRILHTLADAPDQILQAVYSADGRAVFTAEAEGRIRIWDTERGTAIRELHHPGAAQILSTRDGSRLLTLASGQVVLWDPATGTPVVELECREIGYFDRQVAAFSPDGSRLALCTRLDPVLHDTSNGRPVLTVLGHTASVRSVEFSPDGQWLVTASEDGTLRKWRTVDGANIGIWKHDTEVSTARVSPNGRWVAASDRNRALTVRDSGTGQIAARIELLPAPEWPLLFEFSPNSECLAVARYDGAPVELRETRSGILLGQFRDDTENGERRSLQFSPDGRGMAVGSFGSPARVYDCEVCGGADDLLAVAGRRVQRGLSSDERARFIPRRE